MKLDQKNAFSGFCQKFPRARDEVEIFFCQFPNPWALRVSGMGGYTSKCEKKSKSLHPIADLWLQNEPKNLRICNLLTNKKICMPTSALLHSRVFLTFVRHWAFYSIVDILPFSISSQPLNKQKGNIHKHFHINDKE